MLGCHVAYVINASNRGDYSWHEYCVRFWLNLNYKNELDGVTWEQRLFVVVWMALTALALGEDVLVHCRQGCRRSGIVVMLLMAILAVVGFQDLISVLLSPRMWPIARCSKCPVSNEGQEGWNGGVGSSTNAPL